LTHRKKKEFLTTKPSFGRPDTKDTKGKKESQRTIGPFGGFFGAGNNFPTTGKYFRMIEKYFRMTGKYFRMTGKYFRMTGKYFRTTGKYMGAA
jgi:hypothetical protein